MTHPIVNLSKDAAKAALRDAAFTSEDEGRTTVHSFLGMFGADHDLETALAHVDDAEQVAWATDVFRHDLAVLVDGRVFRYDVPRPERVEAA